MNCAVWDAWSVAVPGPTVRVTGGTRVTVAVAVRPAPLTVTVMFCCDVMVAGALYKPEAEMVPTPGLIDHVRDDVEFVSVAENCFVCPLDKDT